MTSVEGDCHIPEHSTEEEGGKGTPKFRKKGCLLPILTDLKEKVLQLEDELKDAKLQEEKDDEADSKPPHIPTFYKEDMQQMVEDKMKLKEQVFQLEDEMKDLKLQLTPPSSPVFTRSQPNYTPVIGSKEQYITDVDVVRYTKQHGNDVYVIHTTWSDRCRFEIYRRYTEFRTFERTLNRLFPLEAGRYKSSDRILPTLQGNTFARARSVQKTRLKAIRDYCQTLLLNLDPHISKAVYVVSFFKAKPGDKQLTRLRRPSRQSLVLSVYPQDVPAGCFFEDFLVIEDHEANGVNQLTVKKGDVVRVIKKEETGWWLVSITSTQEKKLQKEDKGEEADGKLVKSPQFGYVPATFLKKYEDGDQGFLSTTDLKEMYLGFVSSTAPEEVQDTSKYIAHMDYSTDDPRQISFKEGTSLTVVDRRENGWWLVRHNGMEGWAPASYLKPAHINVLQEEVDAPDEASVLEQRIIDAIESGDQSTVEQWLQNEDTKVNDCRGGSASHHPFAVANGTALHWAVYYGQLNIAQLLLRNGADPYRRAVGEETVLHWACQCRDKNNKLLELLLTIRPEHAEALVNVTDIRGWTPLHYACSENNLELIQPLLEAGADPYARDIYKATPEIRVKKDGEYYKEIGTLLSSYCTSRRKTVLQKDKAKGEEATLISSYSLGGYLKGVDVIAETSVPVTNTAQTFYWAGYGLKLHIPEGVLPVDMEECRIFIKVGLSGQFELPDNTSIVSAVYWLDSEPRCKFSQPLTLEIQHCAKSCQTPRLSFARSSQDSPPYTFKMLEGGEFSNVSAYGCMQFHSFALITQLLSRLPWWTRIESVKYRARLYYLMSREHQREIHFMVSKDLDSHATNIQQKYAAKGATIGSDLPVEFESDSISLQLPSEEDIRGNGWKIVTPFSPAIAKEQVDSCNSQHDLPLCKLTAEWIKQDHLPSRLEHKVTIKGAKEPYNYFHIVLESTPPDNTVRQP